MSLRALLSIAAPPVCAACGGHAGSAEPLCARCRRQLRWLASDAVEIGGLRAWAPLAYEDPARALVRALKFYGVVAVADTMAAQIVQAAPEGWLAHGRLVPVPLHPARRRKRGYNQAERIAAALSTKTGLPVEDCLMRAGPRATQVGRGRSERLAGIAGSVRMRDDRAPPARAILVDDVLTTGATLAACAGELSGAGAGEVIGVAYARTQGR
jgi:ComF family protein